MLSPSYPPVPHKSFGKSSRETILRFRANEKPPSRPGFVGRISHRQFTKLDKSAVGIVRLVPVRSTDPHRQCLVPLRPVAKAAGGHDASIRESLRRQPRARLKFPALFHVLEFHG